MKNTKLATAFNIAAFHYGLAAVNIGATVITEQQHPGLAIIASLTAGLCAFSGTKALGNGFTEPDAPAP